MGAIIINNEGSYHTDESIQFSWETEHSIIVSQFDGQKNHPVGKIEKIRGSRRKIMYRSVDMQGNELFPPNPDKMQVEALFLKRFDMRKQKKQELKNARSRTSQTQTKDLSR